MGYLNPVEREAELLKLLQLYIRVVEANKGQPIPNNDSRLFDAEGLAIKHLTHTLSFLQLYRGTKIPEFKVSFFDSSSANVVARAALESFLVFHDIFLNNNTPHETDLKHSAWVLYGLLERSKSPGLSSEARTVITKSREQAESLKTRLKQNPVFCGLSKNIQQKILKGREWRLNSWREMALSAGLSEIHANTFYKFLCGHAHASNISITQIHQARTAQDQINICGATLNVMNIATANMIFAYTEVFPESKRILDSEPSIVERARFWISMGSSHVSSGDNSQTGQP